MAELRKVLAGAGVTGRVVSHEQRRYASPEGTEYVIRIADDEHKPARAELAWRLEAVLETEQRHELLDAATNQMGEVTFVCAVASDGLGWIAEQVDDRGDVVQVALAVADQMVWTTQVASPGTPDTDAWSTMEQQGWTSETTVGEICQQLTSAGQRASVLV